MIQGTLFYNPETERMAVRDCGAIIKSGLHREEELLVYDERTKEWVKDFLLLSLDGEWCLPRCLLRGKQLDGVIVRLCD